MVVTRTACPGLEVVLEVGVPTGDSANALHRRFGERSTSEVRVEDDTRRVDRSSQPRRRLADGDCECVADDIAGL